MPRLQAAHRTSLLSTRLRSVFLEVLTRQVSRNMFRDAELCDIARRVQGSIQQLTGRYFPLYQVVLSIRDLTRETKITSPQRTPRVLKIAVTEPTPQLSMSRRRLERNIPVLQCQLAIPPPMFFAKQPSALQSPSSPSPTGSLYSFSVSHRPSFPTGQACSPITPIDQILHTPLSPPKLPRLVPPAPRTWARLNMEARWGETSPLESPGLPLTPYVLNSTDKPSLKPLQIPGTMLAGDPGLRERHLSPSPQAVSPFEVSGIVPAFPRPSAVRTSSSSHLARAALLRTARPGFARSFSMNGRPIGAGDLEGLSPVPLPFAAQPSSPSSMARPLASPFAIRPDAFDGEYFARV